MAFANIQEQQLTLNS